MRVNIEKVLVDETGKDIEIAKDTKFTLGYALTKALLGSYTTDKATAEQKYERYKIFKKIEQAPDDEVEFEAKEIVIMKEVTGMAYPPLTIGQVWDLLEDK